MSGIIVAPGFAIWLRRVVIALVFTLSLTTPLTVTAQSSATPEPPTDARPEDWTNTDSVQLSSEASPVVAPGDSTDITLTYFVTTPRQRTVVHAALTDDTGNIVEGWTLDTTTVQDEYAAQPGTSFSMDFTVTAPEFVNVSHAVFLQLWSEVGTESGAETGIVVHNITKITVETTPASPTIVCDPAGIGAITCTVDPDRADVVSGSLSIVGAESWTVAANGTAIPPDVPVDLRLILPDGALTGSFTMVSDVTDACADVTLQHTARIAAHYEYANAPAAASETTILVELPTKVPVAPTVSLGSPDFGVLKRDGTSWGTTTAVMPITISRDGCGDLGAYDVQMNVTGLEEGLTPLVTTAMTSGEGISVVAESGIPAAGQPVTVATVSRDFTGTGQVDVVFSLTPDNSMPPGTYTMTIEVSTNSASP